MPRFSFEYKITVGNVITIVLALIPAIYAYATLTGSVSQSAEAVKSIPAIENRVSTIETRINIGQQQREQFQEKTEVALEKLAAQQSQMMAMLAGIVARMDEAEKRR